MRRPGGSELTANLQKISKRAVPVTPADSPNVASERNFEVPLLFEEASPGRCAIDLDGASESERHAYEILGQENCRADIDDFPELSEPQVVRHFLRLSQMNFGQALQFYPLGSCTMKYNPVVNDELAALSGFAALHQLTPSHLAQGALELMARLER